MTSRSEQDRSEIESNSELPEVLDPDEHGPLRFALYDGRVSDRDGIEMPDPST